MTLRTELHEMIRRAREALQGEWGADQHGFIFADNPELPLSYPEVLIHYGHRQLIAESVDSANAAHIAYSNPERVVRVAEVLLDALGTVERLQARIERADLEIVNGDVEEALATLRMQDPDAPQPEPSAFDIACDTAMQAGKEGGDGE